MAGQQNHYPNTSFKKKKKWGVAGDNGLFVWREKAEGKGEQKRSSQTHTKIMLLS